MPVIAPPLFEFLLAKKTEMDAARAALSGLLIRPPPPGGPPSAAALAAARPSSPSSFASIESAVSSLDADLLLLSLLQQVHSVPFKRKQLLGKNDEEVLQALLGKVTKSLTLDFLRVSLADSQPAQILNSDWSSLSACQRSGGGKTGVYFLRRGGGSSSSSSAPASPPTAFPASASASVVCAKSMTPRDYDVVKFVDKLTTTVFGILTPETRLIGRSDPEFALLEASVKHLFSPVHLDLYEAGGLQSPKALFASSSIMLMSLIKGHPLSPMGSLPRRLVPDDFSALGKLFLLDLLLRNTDRLPCRRAIPRPGYTTVEDSGNAGNLIFGGSPGELFSIDPEMSPSMDAERSEEYIESVRQVASEVLCEDHLKPAFRAIDHLWYAPVAGLQGILDEPLESLHNWSSLPPLQKSALDSLLSLLRLRAETDKKVLSARFPSGCSGLNAVSPPSDSVERSWRSWIRFVSCRAVLDVQSFVEAHAAVHVHGAEFGIAFRQGFKQGMRSAFDFARRTSSFDNVAALAAKPEGKVLIETAEESQVDCTFVVRLIRGLEIIDSEYRAKTNFQRIVREQIRQTGSSVGAS